MPYPAEQRRGLFVIGLFVGQVVLGLFIHYIHIPVRIFGHRPPQNFFHAVQGLVILGLANYQVCLCRRCLLHELIFFLTRVGQLYDGIYHKTSFLAADVRQTAKRTWIALVIVRNLVPVCDSFTEFIRVDFLVPLCHRAALPASPVYARTKSPASKRRSL